LATCALYTEVVRALLISTYDLGRQPLGLAAPAATLRQAGVDVDCVDTSREPLNDEHIRSASLVAFYLPMHTATRLAAPLLQRVRSVNPDAQLAAYGLYAPLNRAWLEERGARVLGPDAEEELVGLVNAQFPTPNSQSAPNSQSSNRTFTQPDRTTLLPLSRYAALQMPDGTRRVVGSTDATRGCKHLCRHCPVVPVYQGRFKAVPIDVVMQDIRAQVAARAEHITFGDPDFFNGPTHARRLVERLAAEFPQLTYDVTVKIEHLLAHADLLPLLKDTGCLFITSAVESIDDAVLMKLQKGHTHADFVRAVELCREAGVALTPTFVPFTPWTTVEGYIELLNEIERLDLVEAVATIQLAIRLLVTAESKLLELPDIRDAVEPFDPASLTWPWRHPDTRVDALQTAVMRIAGMRIPRTEAFAAIARTAYAAAGLTRGLAQSLTPGLTPNLTPGLTPGLTPPYMTEGWYCCAEPGPEQTDLV
jgi:radical SAM superfamily enzyme YgiQ (UPF0313 family)